METKEAANLPHVGRYLLILVLCAIGVMAWLRPGPFRAVGALISYQWKTNAPTNKNQTLSLEGLQAPVRVHFDPQGVPHIDAKNERDLVRAAGYIQARDRFFQMDLLRRVARGRLSELIGNRPFQGTNSVAFDRAMRAWGIEARAEQSWRNVSAREKRLLTAFADGVNAARRRFAYPEYRVLGTKPAIFRPADTYAIGMLNAWTISHNWQQELVRLQLAMHLGLDKASKLYPHTPLVQGLSLKSKRKQRPLPPAIAPALQQMFKHPLLSRKPPRQRAKPAHKRPHPAKRASAPWDQALHLAAATIKLSGNSNAWVVNGERSQTGKPLLANDPHLSHLLPSILYQQHLRTPTLDVIGATMPGIPYVLMGHNKRVAWGLTAAVADAMDLVIELPHPTNKKQVRNEGSPCALTVRKIHIHERTPKGMKRHTFTLRETCRGPLLNDMYPHLLHPKAPMVAVQWQLGDVNLMRWSEANRASNVKALYAALRQLKTPVATCQAADIDGNIAIFWAGTVPQRSHRGTFPYPGWRRKFHWRGSLPHTKIPFGYNPPRGFFAHGNNLLVDPRKSEQVLQIDTAPPYRVNRIKKLLRDKTPHNINSFEAIQRDLKVRRAAIVLPHILADISKIKARQTTPAMREARALLRKWDHHARPSSVGTAIFFAIYRNALRIAMREKLSPVSFKFFLSQRYTTNVTDAWFTKRNHIAWDHLDTKKVVEDRTSVVQRAFRQAVEQLRAKQGDHISMWQWGRLHKLQMRHPFGGIPLLGSRFNLPPTKGMGALESVWKSHFDMGNNKTPFRAVAGPAYRMLVDLSDFSKSRWIIDTGASGWPGTPHYGDQFQQWRKGKTVPMRSNWRHIINTRIGTWLLLPKR